MLRTFDFETKSSFNLTSLSEIEDNSQNPRQVDYNS